MSDTENMKGRMRAAFATTPPGDDRWQAVLDVLRANGYRRCAEGQRTTQWCDRAEKAEAEVARLQTELIRARLQTARYAEAWSALGETIGDAKRDLLGLKDKPIPDVRAARGES